MAGFIFLKGIPMKLLPIAVKSGALAKLLNNHIIVDQVLPSNTATEDFPNNRVTVRQQAWQPNYKSVRLTYKTVKKIVYGPGDTYDSIRKWHTDITHKESGWRMAPALCEGALPFEDYANYIGTTQYLSEVIRSIAENITPPTFQQWKERFINA
jgi:hypothetical protein